MSRTLYVDHNNGISDTLEYSTDGGKSKTPYDLTATSFTSLTLQIGTAGAFVLERSSVTHASEFALTAAGVVTWTPGTGIVASADKGSAQDCRWVLVTTAYPDGLVIVADDVNVVD